MKVECPNCGATLAATPEFVGKRVRCQQCKTQFVVPAPVAAAPETQSANPQPAPQKPAAPTGTAFSDFDPAAPAGRQPATVSAPVIQRTIELPEARNFFGGMFDFRFRSFLAPKIICILYALGLLAFLLLVGSATTIFVMVLLAADPNILLGALFWYGINIFSAIAGWLALRLVCETLLIHFYNGSTLKRIESKL